MIPDVMRVFIWQRWNPVDSFSGSRLLPSDRWHFSSEDGLREMPKEDFRLPTSNWEWEGDWSVDENFAGQITDKGVSITVVDSKGA